MGWEDRPYFRDRGASSNPLTNLLSGSVSLFTLFGVPIRAHSALIIFILSEWLFNWSTGYTWPNKFAGMGILCAILLFHELAHCIAARASGGAAEEILLWPLGGLAFPDVPQQPAARFWTAAAGPISNFILCIISGVFLLALRAKLNFNLLHPIPLGLTPHQIAFYLSWTFVISFALLLVNLLPIFPLDGGHMIQSLLFRSIGYHRSLVLAAGIGMSAAITLALLGAVVLFISGTFMILILAAFLFYANYQQRVMLRETGAGEPWHTQEMDYSSSLYKEPPTKKRRVSKRAQRIARKHTMQEAAERKCLDMILAKVSAQGIQSLTWSERRTLRIATEKRRRHDLELKSLLED